MDDNFNRRAIEIFGKDNRNMPLVSSNIYFDQREGELSTYIDLQIVIKWVLPYLSRMHSQKPSVLDVGAGKGRMTRHFAEFFERCVALEPFAEFYRDLKITCTPYENVETYDLTLSEYVSRYRRKFDFIYVSGVTPYLDDKELRLFLRDAARSLEPSGLMCNREWGSPYSTEYLPNAITRSREHSVGMAREAGLVCDRWRRAYPPFFFGKLYELWPNALTDAMKTFAFKRTFFPLWELLAQLNLPRGRRKTYFIYLYRRNTSSIDTQRQI